MLSLTRTTAPEILEALSHSRFRARFHLSDKLLAYAREKNDVLAEHARKLLNERLAPVRLHGNDGRQTPMKGHPVFVAQHATALCCRGCIAKWYGIDPARNLTSDELEAAVQIVLTWIARQVQSVPAHSAQKARRAASGGAGAVSGKQLSLF